MKILDCTLRDGGYYTNWDFNRSLVSTYFKSMNELPIDYLEIGYRSQSLDGYYGEYFYLPVHLIEEIKSSSNKKLVIIINEKDVTIQDLPALLDPIKGLVSMVRLAINPESLERAIGLAEKIKSMGFEVGFNVMYMSNWKNIPALQSSLKGIEHVADYFYMVDSFGGVYPEDILNTIDLVKSQTPVPLGFHGHNNLELALINTITAMRNGVEIVDATIAGMGRGAGNLKTELLLTYLNQKNNLEVNFSALSSTVNSFSDLQNIYQWGTNLPYMVSGANSLPQKDVMEWVSKRFYPLDSIVQALTNKKDSVEDNKRFPLFDAKNKSKKCIIVGGGSSAREVASYISRLITNDETVCLIHASSRNAANYKHIDCEQYFCLVGNEGNRLAIAYGDLRDFKGLCVLPPYPRKMGSVVPSEVEKVCYELPKVDFTQVVKDAHTTLALQLALDLGFSEAMLVGYDGYLNASLNIKEQELFAENEAVFADAKKAGLSLISLTETKYSQLKQSSIFSLFV